MPDDHHLSPRDHGRLLRRTRVIAYRVAKLGKKIDKLQERIRKNGLYLFYGSIVGAGAILISYGSYIWDTLLPYLGFRESIHYSFRLNDGNIFSKTLDYRSRSVAYKFQVAVTNAGDPIGGKGRLLVARADEAGVTQLVAASELQRSIDNMSLIIEFSSTSRTFRPNDLPTELLMCAWQPDGKKRVIPILSRLASEYATTADVKDPKAQRRVGYAPYTSIPINYDQADPLTRSDACEKAVKAVENNSPIKCVPFAAPFESNCRPDEPEPSKDNGQTDAELVAPPPPTVDPIVASKTQMKQRLDGESEWVSCSNGICWERELGRSLAAVKQIDIGYSRDKFDRSVAVPDLATANILAGFTLNAEYTIPQLFALPNAKTHLRLTYFDGTQSRVRTFEDHSNFAAIKGALVHAQEDKQRVLLIAYNPNRQEWSFLPLLKPNETVSGYSIDNGGFYEPKQDIASQLWNAAGVGVPGDIDSGFIRFQINRKDSAETEAIKFLVPADLPDIARSANIMRDPERLIECRNFPESDFRYRNDTSIAGLSAQNQFSMGLNGSGFGFVSEPSIACIIPQLSGAPTADASKVLQSVEFRAEPGSVKRIAPVKFFSSNVNLQPPDYRRNYAHAMMPPYATELYMTFIFKSGEHSRELRIQMPTRH